MTLTDVIRIYEGSDGHATKALYAHLETFGPIGIVAVNLFRACKNSARAKVYRGGMRGRGSYRDLAYDRKQWAMNNLCTALEVHATSLNLTWGWREDPAQEFHRLVLYVDLPTGQVSFHTDQRGTGPDYTTDWDGVRDASQGRILLWIGRVLEDVRGRA